MNYDEFAFFNRQLAGMLKDGIPLEGALRQLCQTMQSGRLRSELEQLERDLAKGTPFKDALAARQLPSFYCQMIQVGVRSNNLVEVLILLADYYQRAQSIRLKLKGLMVYPLLVLGMALAVICRKHWDCCSRWNRKLRPAPSWVVGSNVSVKGMVSSPMWLKRAKYFRPCSSG